MELSWEAAGVICVAATALAGGGALFIRSTIRNELSSFREKMEAELSSTYARKDRLEREVEGLQQMRERFHKFVNEPWAQLAGDVREHKAKMENLFRRLEGMERREERREEREEERRRRESP